MVKKKKGKAMDKKRGEREVNSRALIRRYKKGKNRK